eukprot:COSAG01_NODE_7835_length_3034_cov_2.171380_5_plen_93_part_00
MVAAISPCGEVNNVRPIVDRLRTWGQLERDRAVCRKDGQHCQLNVALQSERAPFEDGGRFSVRCSFSRATAVVLPCVTGAVIRWTVASCNRT